jgi:hypothetical protein
MRGTLVLAVLTVKSSYLQEIEEPLEDAHDIPDTLQWWIASENSWRIKTFALDHDIHTHSVDRGGPELVALAQSNNLKHYGDVVGTQHVLEFQDSTNLDEVRRVFEQVDLEPRLEVAAGRFAFWKPDEAKYHTQSQPK